MPRVFYWVLMGIREVKTDQIDLTRFDPEKASPIELMIAAGTFEDWRASLTEEEKDEIDYMWEEVWARPNQKEPDGVFMFWLLLLGRGGGKRLAINTEIPTSDGFKMMSNIKVGDKVFDENGKECNVTFVSEVCDTPDLYKVFFDNGSYVYADAEHQWFVYDFLCRKNLRRYKNTKAKAKVVDTEFIKNNLYYDKNANFAVPVPKPVEYSEKVLPLEPYLVGALLSQFSYREDLLLINNIDVEIIDRIRSYGYRTKFVRDSDNYYCTTYKIHSDEFDVLERIKYLNLKFRRIPQCYLTASIEQRKELLYGIMDGMGHRVKKKIVVEFHNNEMAFKADFLELLASLGIKVCNNPKINIVEINFIDYPLFTLKRKLRNQKTTTRNINKYLYIVGVEKINPIPAKCITVDSENGVYLCTRNYIPTHNTRTGAEWIRKRVEVDGARHIALVARSPAEANKVMVKGPAGILAVSRPDFMPVYNGSALTLTWPNGAQAYIFSSFEPDKLRGPQFDTAWCDELAAWKYLNRTWDNLVMGLRLNENVDPKCIITTTPRPLPIIKEWVAESADSNASSVRISYGSTYENTFLAPSIIKEMRKKYEGTKIGEQELYGKILGDAEGALWSISNLELHRIDLFETEEFKGRTEFERKWNFITENIVRIVISIDPSVGSSRDDTGGNEVCETGIIVAGLGKDGHGYLLEDCSKRATPAEWARTAVNAYHRYKADRIVAETNQGGDMVEAVLRSIDDNISYKKVFGKKGKYTRAEPISSLYEQGKIHHVGPSSDFEKLENQMINWIPGSESPDRLDAMVWAFLELMVDSGPTFGAIIESNRNEVYEKRGRGKEGFWEDTRVDLWDSGADASSLW